MEMKEKGRESRETERERREFSVEMEEKRGGEAFKSLAAISVTVAAESTT